MGLPLVNPGAPRMILGNTWLTESEHLLDILTASSCLRLMRLISTRTARGRNQLLEKRQAFGASNAATATRGTDQKHFIASPIVLASAVSYAPESITVTS